MIELSINPHFVRPRIAREVEKMTTDNKENSKNVKLLGYLYALEQTNDYPPDQLGYNDDVQDAIDNTFTREERDRANTLADEILSKKGL